LSFGMYSTSMMFTSPDEVSRFSEDRDSVHRNDDVSLYSCFGLWGVP
jgi:hypothetical protein